MNYPDRLDNLTQVTGPGQVDIPPIEPPAGRRPTKTRYYEIRLPKDPAALAELYEYMRPRREASK